MREIKTPVIICEVRFPETKAGNTVGFKVVEGVRGFYYLYQFSDMVAGRGFCIRRWLTVNAAMRHLAYFLTPKH
jgi:hypothetical protein